MACLLGWVWGGVEALGKGLHREPPTSNHGILNPSLSPGHKKASELRLGRSTSQAKQKTSLHAASTLLQSTNWASSPRGDEPVGVPRWESQLQVMWWGVAKTEGKATTSNSAFIRGSCCAPGGYSRGLSTPFLGCGCGRGNGCVMKREL